MNDLDLLSNRVLEKAHGCERLIVAIAGPPGSGKSTISAKLVGRLNDGETSEPSVVFPMDGFHLDNKILTERGWLPRKGAPHTFDTDAFFKTLKEIHDHRRDVPIPVYDRTASASIIDAGVIRLHHRIVVTEGNYLLLDQAPWRTMKPLFDLTVYLSVEPDILEERLIRRWTDRGAEFDAARNRALSNDMPNARLVAEKSVPADLTLGDAS
ncbi:MAG: AAA family ATPase [Rhodospirillales bacterium]|mgnify:CR=1 FL=1|nr:AAA family ATPase [Rhodospirillales bacterium]